MSKDNSKFTFAEVCNRIQKKGYGADTLLEDIPLFLEVATAFLSCTVEDAGMAVASVAAGTVAAPLAIGAGIVAIITAISEKSKIFDGIKKIIEFMGKDDTPGYMNRYERMRDAYILVCVTSFFDAYSETLPDEIRKKIEISDEEKKYFLEAVKERKNSNTEMSVQGNTLSDIQPDIVHGMNEVYPRLSEFYKKMAEYLKKFIHDLSFYQEGDEKTQRTTDDCLDELPDNALKFFKSQYLTLCSNFGDFYAYVNIEKEREYQKEADERYKNVVETLHQNDTDMKQCLQVLYEKICSIPAFQRTIENEKVIQHMQTKYQKAISETIFSNDNSDGLTYPTIEKAFVPQRYKLLKYTERSQLELEKTWGGINECDDMKSYWMRYILDPQNTEKICLVLGDPGSGKSLLMKMISAYLSHNKEWVIKVPLRDYSNMGGEMDIESLICKQIDKDGDTEDETRRLKKITGDNIQRPVTVIFDGYDEIQQATGLAFRTFLTKLEKFQSECSENNRPIRAIVTSRRTLIDRVDIPIGTTVMKLLDFNDKQKQQWVKVWNRHNHDCFTENGLMEFALPEKNKEIDELSGQPLLLLMLAMYDADLEKKRNALKISVENDSHESFNRMKLYDELIRRFVRRELEKGERADKADYEKATDEERAELTDAEMEKLGITAFGMFSREKLFITVPELKNDIEKFNIDIQGNADQDRRLDSHEIFFGSFFFIHDSRSDEKNNLDNLQQKKESEKNASFVFLHKTFYEFLTADFILSKMYQYVTYVLRDKGKKKKFYESDLQAYDSYDFCHFYLAASSYPLCSEPEIIKMIGEWSRQKFNILSYGSGNTMEDIMKIMHDIIRYHVSSIKNGQTTFSPSHLLADRTMPQSNAVYMINLVTLSTLFSQSFDLDEELWHFIAQYAKLNVPRFKENDERTPLRHKSMDVSEELPLRFTSFFDIKSENDKVTISISPYFNLINNNNLILTPLYAKTKVFEFLQDNISKNIFELNYSHQSISKKIKLLKKIISFDKIFRIDRDIFHLQKILLNNNFYSSDLIEYVDNFDDYLSFDSLDTSRIITWLTLYRQLTEVYPAYVFHTGYRKMSSAKIFRHCSHSLFEALSKIYPIDGDIAEVFGIWVDILRKLKITFVLQELCERICMVNKPLYIISVIAQAIPYSESEYERFGWYNDIPQDDPTSVLAAVSEIDRKHYTPNDTISSRMLDLWLPKNPKTLYYRFNKHRILPLLRELVIRGKNEYVRVFLDSINVENLIENPKLIEYAAIADIVSASDFLTRIVKVVYYNEEHYVSPSAISAFLRAAYALLSTDIPGDTTDEIITHFWATELMVCCTEDDLLQTVKMVCLILRKYEVVPTSEKIIDIITKMLYQFEIILKESPFTALELLSLYIKKIDPDFPLTTQFLTIARLEGYSEEINALHFETNDEMSPLI